MLLFSLQLLSVLGATTTISSTRTTPAADHASANTSLSLMFGDADDAADDDNGGVGAEGEHGDDDDDYGEDDVDDDDDSGGDDANGKIVMMAKHDSFASILFLLAIDLLANGAYSVTFI